MASSSKFPGVRKKAPGKFIIDYKDHNNKRRQITYLGIETDAVRARKALLVKRDRIIAGLEAPPEAIKVPQPFRSYGKNLSRIENLRLQEEVCAKTL